MFFLFFHSMHIAFREISFNYFYSHQSKKMCCNSLLRGFLMKAWTKRTSIKTKTLFGLSLVIISFSLSAQNNLTNSNKYDFIIRDSPPSLFTMRQSNTNYLSAYRLYSRTLDEFIENERLNNLVQLVSVALLFIPITHEEGHRSVLTTNELGGISKPFFNSKGAAYVTGVTDFTLITLRDGSLPEYVRLHTAGIESDYMLTNRVETMLAFNQEKFKIVKWEYLFRKLAIVQYMVSGLLKLDPKIKEEDNEWERDIVGHDIYGAARHLFRPSMEFYRYTNYNNLETDEINLVKRIGYRSFLNLLNPLMLGKDGFQIKPNIKILAGLGYSLTPFGDHIDEKIWLKINQYNIGFYLRQFQNHKRWFHGFGVSLTDFTLHNKVIGSVNTHFWIQPENFDFCTSSSFTGGAIDATIQYLFFSKNSKLGINAISIDLGVGYKSKGFLPEESMLDEHFGIRLGTSIWLN